MGILMLCVNYMHFPRYDVYVISLMLTIYHMHIYQ